MEPGSRIDSTAGTDVRPSVPSSDQAIEFPSMSYTAVTSNREMAGSFSRYLLAAAVKMVPREWSVQELSDVLNFVLEGGNTPAQIVEGRYLRRRLREEVARADRHQEQFSIMVLGFEGEVEEETYEGLVDVLQERLRRSDLVFLYKHRIAILLPHTPETSLERLCQRISKLAAEALRSKKVIFSTASYPGKTFAGPDTVLDWVEDRLR